MRAYGRERLRIMGEEPSTLARHLDYFRQLATTARTGLLGPDQSAWVERLRREHDNLRTALASALAAPDAVPALELSASLHWFWFMQGHLSEAQVPELLASCAEAPNPIVELDELVSADAVGLDALQRVEQQGAQFVGLLEYLRFELDALRRKQRT